MSTTDHPVEPAIEKRNQPEDAAKTTSPYLAEEKCMNNTAVIRDITIGFADGLTVPFALTAGLASLGSTRLVIIGGLAELFSGAISMGLGAYLAAATERDLYLSEHARIHTEILYYPDIGKKAVYQIMRHYHVSPDGAAPLVGELSRNRTQWAKFRMDFGLKLESSKLSRPWLSAATMGFSYFLGGLVPMIPYFAMKDVNHALAVSVGVTVVILLGFGFLKNWIIIRTVKAGSYGACQTLFIGILAAGASYGIVRALDSYDTTNAVQL